MNYVNSGPHSCPHPNPLPEGEGTCGVGTFPALYNPLSLWERVRVRAGAQVSILLFLTPAIAMLAGLAVTPLMALIIALTLFLLPGGIKANRDLALQGGIVFALFLLWSLMGSLWATHPSATLILLAKLLALIGGGALAVAVAHRLFAARPQPYLPVASLCLALLVATEEHLSGGFLTTLLHSSLGNPGYEYNLTELNRGATLLALCIFPCVAILLKKHRKHEAILLAAVTFIMLLTLKSLSAVMGIVAGGGSFLLVYYVRGRAIPLLMTATLVFTLLLPVIMTLQNPHALMARFPFIPESSEHRLYIWHFASHKALDHPLRGWGLNASRFIPIAPSDMLPNNKSPLPIHPHNSVTQLWLELGVPGVVLFAAFLFVLFRTIRATENDTLYQAACTAGLMAYYTIGLTAFGIWQEWWIASGLLLAFLLVYAKTPDTHNAAHATSNR